MDKVTLMERITAIGSCEDEAERRELLTQLGEDAGKDYDRITELETQNGQLTSDNESLRSANMKLFLRVGDHKAEDKEKSDDIEKKDFKNLFNEKGELK
jgi:regulator of replication initiation timing